MDALPLPQEVARLLVAALLGALIGLERERLDRGAGLRTHTLVATAAALVMLVSSYGFVGVVTADRTIALDPSRIAAQVVSGIGFLGAGTIILRRNAVRGLTTAASVWAVAAIGLASGAGMFAAAVTCTVILLIVLIGLKPVERRMFGEQPTAPGDDHCAPPARPDQCHRSAGSQRGHRPAPALAGAGRAQQRRTRSAGVSRQQQ